MTAHGDAITFLVLDLENIYTTVKSLSSSFVEKVCPAIIRDSTLQVQLIYTRTDVKEIRKF